MDYWQERAIKTQEKLTNKNIEDTEKQLRAYYRRTARLIENEFVSVYQKLYNTVVRDNHTPTPADLYKLDAYWKLQGQLRWELTKLGDKQSSVMRRKFVEQWMDIYNNLPIKGGAGFTTTDENTALQMINHIWCADGKSWSDRVWSNTDKLQQDLNDGLIECVLGGRDEKHLKHKLMNDFNVSFSRADSLVRTELSHIQAQAAKQRYEDAGLKQLEVWASKDERRCEICGKLHQKRFLLTEKCPIPAHPKCRCCVLPVMEPQGAK